MNGLCAGPKGPDASLITFMEVQVDSPWQKSEAHALVYSQVVCSPSNLLIIFLTDCSPAGDNCKTVTAVERFP
jgi:hypothetical protein